MLPRNAVLSNSNKMPPFIAAILDLGVPFCFSWNPVLLCFLRRKPVCKLVKICVSLPPPWERQIEWHDNTNCMPRAKVVLVYRCAGILLKGVSSSMAECWQCTGCTLKPHRSCNTCDGFQLVPNSTRILMSLFHFWCQFTSVSVTQLHRMHFQLRFSSKSLAWPRANARLLLCEWPCSFMLPWVWLVSCWAGLKNWWCGNSLLAGARTTHVLCPYDDYDLDH